MARPKKPRFVDGILLPDNLYKDPKGRINYWRYKRRDGTEKIFHATLEDAVEVANATNKEKGMMKAPPPRRDSVIKYALDYEAYREKLDPSLQAKESWKTRGGYLRQFATEFTTTPISHLDLISIQNWWDHLTGYAQRSRRSEFNKFFNWLMSKDVVPLLKGNPFTTADDRPRVLMKPLPKKERQRLDKESFWKIYEKAGELGLDYLQIGMGISLLTTMRRGDIVYLKFDRHIVNDQLCKGISKSHEKAENGEGANLRWDLSDNPMLRELIARARELSLKHYRCPYVINRLPQKRVMGKKTHHCQVLPRIFSDAFVEARDATGLFSGLEKRQKPTFHEIRALGSHLYGKAGYDIGRVQELMAHTDAEMTEHYQAGHEIQWTDIDMTISEKVLGGSF